MSTDIKLNKAHFSNIIQSEGAFGVFLGKFAGSLMNHLDKHVLALLATMACVCHRKCYSKKNM